MAIDPVCGMKVDESSVSQTYEYDGKMYYFCPRGCRIKFMQNPEKYLQDDNGNEHWTFHT